MRILIVGATGTIGRAVAAELADQHELLRASYSKAPLRVDIGDPASIRALYGAVGVLDAVISIAGPVRFKPFAQLTRGLLVHPDQQTHGTGEPGAHRSGLGDRWWFIHPDERSNKHLVRLALDLDQVFTNASELSRAYTAKTFTRSVDLLHVAASHLAMCTTFVSADDRQLAVARATGLKAVDIKSRTSGR